MWCGKCENDPCTCVRPLNTMNPIRDTSVPSPPNAITKEEFGIDLFEAISCCGGILQLRQLREKTPPAKIKPKQLTAWQTKERELTVRAKELVAILPDDQAADVIRRYPWLLTA